MSWERSRGISTAPSFPTSKDFASCASRVGAEYIDRAVQLVSLRQLLPRQPWNGAGNEHFRNAVGEPPGPVRIQFGILEGGD